ncbi:MAG: hypothetical protein KF892_23570 [Rhizobacter sp.]|nr:hypothetical protein [Rhizobacter sp.]
MRYDCGSITLEFPVGWFDTTTDDLPFTLSKTDGVGALQFSVATYKEGSPPAIDVAALGSMVAEFAKTNSLDPLRDRVQMQDDLLLAAASFTADEGTHGRVWYVSDGWSLAKITYVCEQVPPQPELHEAEQIVRSLQFSPSDA